MMEYLTYYIEDEYVHGFTYSDIVSMVHNGTLSRHKTVLAYDSLTRHKEYYKVKDLL